MILATGVTKTEKHLGIKTIKNKTIMTALVVVVFIAIALSVSFKGLKKFVNQDHDDEFLYKNKKS